MLNMNFDNISAINKEKEKAKHRFRRINSRKAKYKIDNLKFINSNRHGLININTGKRMYKSKDTKLKQKATNKKIRQDNLKIKSTILDYSQKKNSDLAFINILTLELDSLEGVNNGEYKKIKTKNSFNGDKDIWKEPWLIYKPNDVYRIPKFNSTRDEKGQKPIKERKVSA